MEVIISIMRIIGILFMVSIMKGLSVLWQTQIKSIKKT